MKLSEGYRPGQIRDEDRIRQVMSFDGLIFGSKNNISPSDLDLGLELRNKLLLLGEAKYKDAPIHNGQRWLLERMIDAWGEKTGRHGVGYIIRHESDEPTVDLAPCPVVRYYHKGLWKEATRDISLKEAMEGAIKHFKVAL